MRSQMAEASSSRWVTNMMATPSLRSRSMIDSSLCTSVSVSAEVGSSMMMSRLFSDSARAISTSCCSATDSAETGRQRIDGQPDAGDDARESSSMRRQLTSPSRPIGARPMKMFSATVSVGIRLSSW